LESRNAGDKLPAVFCEANRCNQFVSQATARLFIGADLVSPSRRHALHTEELRDYLVQCSPTPLTKVQAVPHRNWVKIAAFRTELGPAGRNAPGVAIADG